jgi:hypothetical protein
MKTTVLELRQLITEEYLRGIPEFVLRNATKKYVDEIKQHISRYIMANKSNTSADRRAALAAADSVLEDLEKKVNDLLENQLFAFTRQV